MLEQLKEQVCEANLQLVRAGLVIHTFGNVSGVDRTGGHLVIKPSGVSYDAMKPRDMVVVSLASGKVVEGELRPSSDTPTHRVLALAFPQVGGIVHTHSLYATAWAQAGCEIPPLGTTHADYCHGAIPCTRQMTQPEIEQDYEAHTGDVIVERYRGLDPMRQPMVLVASHGPFTWGKDAADAVHHAEVLEYLARLASETFRIQPAVQPMAEALLNKHFFRKHGPGAYYGQKSSEQH